MKKILIIHATYGNGHKKVANYIKENFTSIDKDMNIEVIDLLDYANPFMRVASVKLFEKTMFAKVPIFWELIYKFYNNKYRSFGSRKLCYHMFDKKKLRNKIINFNPDVIISTHYFGSMIAAKYKKDNLIKSKLYTIITDYEVHEFWLKSLKYEDAIIVSNNEMRKEVLKRGIDKKKVKVFGIPLAHIFDVELEKDVLLQKFKLNKDKETLLFFGGGNNSNSSVPYFKKIIEKDYNLNIIFLAGNNHKLKQEVSTLVANSNLKDIRVTSYVESVFEYMCVSDIIVTKPGGLTVSECLALSKPMLIISKNAGQERANYKYLVKKKYALKASNPKGFAKHLNTIKNHPDILDKMSNNIRKSGKKNASMQLYDLVTKK